MIEQRTEREKRLIPVPPRVIYKQPLGRGYPDVDLTLNSVFPQDASLGERVGWAKINLAKLQAAVAGGVFEEAVDYLGKVYTALYVIDNGEKSIFSPEEVWPEIEKTVKGVCLQILWFGYDEMEEKIREEKRTGIGMAIMGKRAHAFFRLSLKVLEAGGLLERLERDELLSAAEEYGRAKNLFCSIAAEEMLREGVQRVASKDLEMARLLLDYLLQRESLKSLLAKEDPRFMLLLAKAGELQEKLKAWKILSRRVTPKPPSELTADRAIEKLARPYLDQLGEILPPGGERSFLVDEHGETRGLSSLMKAISCLEAGDFDDAVVKLEGILFFLRSERRARLRQFIEGLKKEIPELERDVLEIEGKRLRRKKKERKKMAAGQAKLEEYEQLREVPPDIVTIKEEIRGLEERLLKEITQGKSRVEKLLSSYEEREWRRSK